MGNLADKLGTVRVAIYVRVSTQYQIDKDSLPVQRKDLISYSQLMLNAESYEIFEDAGFSGKNTSRPDYQKMMARIRAGEFTHLLVWKLDRISRNLLDFAAMYEELKRLGVVFVSKNEQFDTSSAMGEAMLKIILVFAELERKMTSERVSAVLLARAANGQWNGGRVPFGYDFNRETGEFTINLDEGKVVELIYDLYEKYHSLVYVARTLNEAGYKTRALKEWSPTTAGIILNNSFYVGIYRYNCRAMRVRGSRQDVNPEEEWVITENHHPAIISRERWEAVNKILVFNRRGGWNTTQPRTYTRKNTHVFAGLLTCACCGRQMSATSNGRVDKNGYRPSNYACMSHRKNNGCHNKYVTDKTLGPFVLNFIANMMRARESFGKTTSEQTLEKKLLRGEMFSKVEHIKEDGLHQLYLLYRSGVTGEQFNPQYVDAEPNEIARERNSLLSEHRSVERAMERLKNLYLYSEENMSEKDYVIEKAQLVERLEKIDARLDEIQAGFSGQFDLTDNELLEKASYFVLSQRLLDKRFIDYRRLLEESEPQVLKEFINTVISNFCILDGKIISITFKNGIIIEFDYKSE